MSNRADDISGIRFLLATPREPIDRTWEQSAATLFITTMSLSSRSYLSKISRAQILACPGSSDARVK